MDLGSPAQRPPVFPKPVRQLEALMPWAAWVARGGPHPPAQAALVLLTAVAHPPSSPHLRIRIALHFPACMWIFVPHVPFCNPPPISCLSSYFVAGCDLFLSMCHIMITTTTTNHSTLHDSFSCF